MTLGAMSMAWIAAEAALPLGWLVIGVTRDPRSPDEWTAIATGPLQPTDVATGKGDQPAQALNRLADALREMRGSATGGDQ